MEHIPEPLKVFIVACFETVDELRILLLLQASLRRLCQQGVVATLDGDDSQYEYQPSSTELEQVLRAVAELDRTRPVTLIRLIYTHPIKLP
jgi:hypothetical protein